MEKSDCRNTRQHKDNRNKVGLIFLVIGLILLGKNMHFIPSHWSSYLFSWQMLIIAIGAFMVIMNRRNVGGLVMIGIGGLFLWNKINPLSALQWEIAWPAIFIFIGIILIVGYLSKPTKVEKIENIEKPIKPKKAKPKSKYDDVEFDIDKIEPIEY